MSKAVAQRQGEIEYLMAKVYKSIDTSALVRMYSQGRTSDLSDLTDREYEQLQAELEDCILYINNLKKWRCIALLLMTDYGIATHKRKEVDSFVLDLGLSADRFANLTIDDLFRLSCKLRRLLARGEQYTSKNNRR